MDLHSLSRLLPFFLAICLASTAVAAPPTLTTIQPLAGSKEDTKTDITFANLRDAADEADSDGTPVEFRLESIKSGTLRRNGAEITDPVLGQNDTWTWTPAPNDFNETTGIHAFSVFSYSGGEESATPVAVYIKVPAVNDVPSFSAGESKTVLEDAGPQEIPNWATNLSKGASNETNQALSFVLATTNSALFAAGPAVDSFGKLTFTPALNQNGTASISIKLRDDGGTADEGKDESAAQNFSISVTAADDPPTLGGELLGTAALPLDDADPTSPLAENATITHYPFSGVTVEDPDNDKPSAAPQTVSVTIPLSADELGAFTFSNFSRIPSPDNLSWIYSITSPSTTAAQAQLRAVKFVPRANAKPVGVYQFPVKIELRDNTGLSASPIQSAIHVRSLNDPPQMTATISVASIVDSSEVSPFRVSVSDPDPGDSFSLTVSEPAVVKRGTLYQQTSPINGGSDSVAAAVQSIRYRATPLDGSVSKVTASIRFALTDVHPDGTAEPDGITRDVSLDIRFVNDPPTISGVSGDVQRMTDNPGDAPVFPFSRVTISEPDANQPVTVTLSLDDPAKGTFSTTTPLNGSASHVTELLRRIRFIPTKGRLPVDTSESVRVTVSVRDSDLTATNNQTLIEVTAVNGAPAIYWDKQPINAGTFPEATDPETIESSAGSRPFAKVTIEDEGNLAITVKLDNAGKGMLQLADGVSESPVGSRVYKFSGDAKSVTAKLEGLVYVINSSYQFPPNQPGRTDFTITASDSALNTTLRVLPVMLKNNARNLLVTQLTDDNSLGTLRRVIASAESNDVITFALASYPAVIRLNKSYGPLRIDKHLTFLGPGSDKLTISGDSNSNGLTEENDVQLFRIHANVTFKSLRFSRGFSATNGGGFFVGRADPGKPPGILSLQDCTVANCTAAYWGGGVDVAEGSLQVERCLFENNRLGSSSGLGGGAVSCYTDEDCTFVNTTFSGNAQPASTGYGGGGLYAENFTASSLCKISLTHCTFKGNTDGSGNGSSIHSNVANTRVLLANSVFDDDSAHNLKVAGSGEIVSKGGNLSNDNTATTRLQGGVPQQTVLLSDSTDQRAIDPLLNPLTPLVGISRGHQPKPGSPLIGRAISKLAVVDQSGLIRNDTADIGAVEADAQNRILIHEIFQSAQGAEFIEFFNPRNGAAFDLNGYQLWVNGMRRHTFGPAIIQPGAGYILTTDADSPPSVPVSTPPGEFPETPVEKLPALDALSLSDRGSIELRAPNGNTDSQVVVTAVSYNTAFFRPTDPPILLSGVAQQSITLAPQFQGAAFIPNGLVGAPPNSGVNLNGTGPDKSPGTDTGRTPFGNSNAFPFAVADPVEVTEDEITELDLLANDLDADGTDRLFIVDLATSPPGPLAITQRETTTTTGGSTVTVSPATSPLLGTAVSIDPRAAFNSLPAGERRTDTFAYSIIDVGHGPILGYSLGSGSGTRVRAPNHRLKNGAEVAISGSPVPAYNGRHEITKVDNDWFDFAVPYSIPTPAGADSGTWQASIPRDPSKRSDATVTVTVLGRNDPPIPGADLAATNEETILRIFGDANYSGTGTALDTDGQYPEPRSASSTSLLANDTDPDTNDTQLDVVGVCQASPILSITGTKGDAPLIVTAVGPHELQSGSRVLISGCMGHPSYNGYHEVTVTGANTFTIPVTFTEPADIPGLWAVLEDSNRLTTTSLRGAAVRLEIRANRAQTNVVYNPRSSASLDHLADGESAMDSFYYAVEDHAGAVSLAEVTIEVSGVNDAPIPTDNPPGLADLKPTIPAGQTLEEFLKTSEILYVLPGIEVGTATAVIQPSGTNGGTSVSVSGLPWTHEDAGLELASSSLLADDTDVDTSDELRIELRTGQTVSREGATLSLSPDGSTLTYDPTHSATLQALAFKERVIDTFYVTVSDGISRVSSRVAVLVEGRNDAPVAADVALTTDEKTLLEIRPPGLLLSGTEIDQNTRLPDDRKFLLPVVNASTNFFGTRVDVEVAPREGVVESFSATAGSSASTTVRSSAHGLQSGEEVVFPTSGALTGQHVVTRVSDDSFTLPVPWDSGFATLSGHWQVIASTFKYDPRGSVFAGPTGDPSVTLQGLAEGQSFTDTVTYTLLDGSYLFANDDIFRVEVDRSSVELRVLENDASLDGLGTTRKIIAAGPPSSGGTVSVNGGESLLYTPETGFVGDEHFTYTIEDSLGNRDTALVTARVTVDRLNGNLRASDDRFTVAAGQAPLLHVTANDSIIPATGDALVIESISQIPDAGGQAVVENGRIRYTPSGTANPDSYVETFSYVISGGGTARATALVSVLVVDRTDKINVRPDSFGVPSGSSEAVLNVLENDNILPGTGDQLEITGVSLPAHGTVVIVDAAALAYTPAPGFLGTDTFTYTVSDQLGGTGTAHVTVQVGYLTTNTDFFSVPYDDQNNPDDGGSYELDVLANDNVLLAGAGAVSITAVSHFADLGAMSVSADRKSLVFDPGEDKRGQHEFTYTISDSSGRTATGSVTIVILEHGIRASSDFFTVQTNSSENSLDVLANDRRISDLLGDLSVSAIGTGPNAPDNGGTVEISADYKSLKYTPAPGFRGTETFTYTVTDGERTDTARISVRSTLGQMIAAQDEFLVFRGSTANRLPVLLNDRILPDSGQLLTITALSLDSGNPNNPASRGTLAIIEDGGALSYTPSAANTADEYEETFTYEISSGGTSRTAGLIHIVVLNRVGARDLEANDDNFAVRSDSAGTVLPALANDGILPANAGKWVITDVTNPTPNVCAPFLLADFPDPVALANSLMAHSDPVSLFLWNRISAASQASLAAGGDPVDLQILLARELNSVVASGSSIFESARFAGVSLREKTQALLTNGASGEQLLVLNRLLLEDAFPVSIRSSIGGGVVILTGTNLVYQPQPGFVGSVRFTYRVSDGLGGTGSAEVTVRVGDVSVSEDRFSVLAGAGAVILPVVNNDGILRTTFPATQQAAQSDFSLTPARPVTVLPTTAGSARVRDGQFQFEPSASFQGRATLTYWVEDDGGCIFPGTAQVDVYPVGGDRDTALATVTITGVNDPPQLLNAGPSAILDTETVRPFENATVIEHDDQRLQLVTVRISFPASHGALGGGFSLVSPGLLQFQGTAAQVTAAMRGLIFTPVKNRIPVGEIEDTTFSVTLNDPFVTVPVQVDSAVVTVTPVNDPPILTGTVAGQKLYQYSSIQPFAGVNITDVDDLGLQLQTVSVKINDPTKGVLIGTGFSQQPPGSGIYIMQGSPLAVASSLRGLTFTPTPSGRIGPQQSETATFTITVSDGFAPAVIDANTSVIILHGEIDSILPLDPSTGADISQKDASFGATVAISRDTLVVGSPNREGTKKMGGEVFIYERNAGRGAPWGQVARLVPADVATDDHFGSAVSIDGDWLAVGAPDSDAAANNAGAVYLYRRSVSNPLSWSQHAKILPPVVSNYDSFGAAVSISGDTLLVGAPNANLPGLAHSGRVFAYRLGGSTWSHVQTIVASENRGTGKSDDDEWFGAALSTEGNTMVVGSPGANKGSSSDARNFGAAYVFTRASSTAAWTERKRLDEFNDPSGLKEAGFGYSVGLSGDRVAIGIFSTKSSDEDGKCAGVRVFSRNLGGVDQWGMEQRLTAVEQGRTNYFGFSVALSGDILMVGSPKRDKYWPDLRGRVDLFRRNATSSVWSSIDSFTPGAIPSKSDRFGAAVALDRFTAAVGAPDDGNYLWGFTRVYQFQYDLSPRFVATIPDQIAAESLPFQFAVPEDTFGDPQYPNNLTITARNIDGSLLASGWLAFNPTTRVFTGTPTSSENRRYDLILTAINPAGLQVISNAFSVSVSTTNPPSAAALQSAYQKWSVESFNPPGSSEFIVDCGMNGDCDNDQNVNLLEMLFGTSPLQSDAPKIDFKKLTGSQFSISFPVSDEFPRESIHVEWSTDAKNWTREKVELLIGPVVDGVSHATAIVSPPGSQVRAYVRIAADSP